MLVCGRRGRRPGREGTGLCPPVVGEGKEKQAGVRPSGLGGAGVRGRGYPVVGRPSLCRLAADGLWGTGAGWREVPLLPVGRGLGSVSRRVSGFAQEELFCGQVVACS